MAVELNGAAGKCVVDESGVINFIRDERSLLQTLPLPAFFKLPVELPGSLSSRIEEQPGHLVIHYTVPEDPNQAPALSLEIHPGDTGFRLILNAVPALRCGLNFYGPSAGAWYGLGERVVQNWPLDAGEVTSDPFIPFDNGPDGTLNLVTPLLLTQSGAALLLDETPGTFFVNLNRDGAGTVQVGISAGGSGEGLQLVAEVVLADDIKQATLHAIQLLGHPIISPPEELWTKPIWTTWARYKMEVSQKLVLEFADEIIAHAYPYSVMEIDDRWQTAYGDLAFDPEKFPDPGAMVEKLHRKGFRVTLWVPPFFDPQSPTFTEAARQGFLVQDKATGQPALTKWWQGVGGLIDVTNPAALAWWRAGLQRLQTEYGIDGFKFDGGEANFVPDNFQTFKPIEPRRYPDFYVAWVAENFAWTEVRTGWKAQRQGIFFRQWDKWSRWGLDNGLHAVLTQALTMSLTGYPFILPDMIGGNAYSGENPDAELLVRWTQLNALLPAMQFSVPPWSFNEETDAICHRYTLLHQELWPYFERQLEETLKAGIPLVLPLFWRNPQDAATYAINDQFLLGETLLVAPVVQPGQTSRDIYLPEGRWRDYWSGEVYQGGQWLKDYPAGLNVLPLFESVTTP